MKKIIGVFIVLAVMSVALPAFAQTRNASSTRPVFHGNRSASTTAAMMTSAKNRASAEINNRVTTLNDLLSRIESVAKISSSEKSSMSSDIQSEISALSSLNTNISNDTSTTTLRSDSASITKAYRIYALVVPQTSIVAAADRVNTIVTSLTTIGTKLQTRVTAAGVAGTDISAMTSTLLDFNAKVSDAGAQAIAATNEVANLAPDNGDNAVLASNTAALKDARSKIQTATKDLQIARQDANTIVKAIQGANSTATSTVGQ